MATTCFALWLQEPDLAKTNHLIMIFIGMVAVAMTVMAIALIVMAVVGVKAIKSVMTTVEDVTGKALPLIESATEISRTSQDLLRDVGPKVKVITDNVMQASETLAETSKAARATIQQIDATIADANQRTQKQVARVDGMVTVALTTAAEVAEAIGNGIRVPAQKIAAAATQAKAVAEGLLAKIRSMAGATPFGRRDDSDQP
jgi:methyl-accepting chemotaxis protein